eukprot:GAFH01001279.1.p5 GENE.GAFH01001279.1~~GAFH01001279.1.p5  ORF type:complete len:152 (+),score=34.38 GAFH01001279.1:749-1204(+)
MPPLFSGLSPAPLTSGPPAPLSGSSGGPLTYTAMMPLQNFPASLLRLPATPESSASPALPRSLPNPASSLAAVSPTTSSAPFGTGNPAPSSGGSYEPIVRADRVLLPPLEVPLSDPYMMFARAELSQQLGPILMAGMRDALLCIDAIPSLS